MSFLVLADKNTSLDSVFRIEHLQKILENKLRTHPRQLRRQSHDVRMPSYGNPSMKFTHVQATNMMASTSVTQVSEFQSF